VLVAGDLNDGVDAATTQLLQGPPGSELGTPGFGRPDQGDGERLWNLTPLLAEPQRFTRVFRGRREVIDHIFASHVLAATMPAVSTALAAGRLVDHRRPRRAGRPARL
jgi:endonuclease/exonuclease/phosphatase family metal-dependent hydrolase